jgi:hypothetical protein
MNRLKNRLLTCGVIGFALVLCACGAEDAINNAVNNATESTVCQAPDGTCAVVSIEKCQAAGGTILLAETCPAPASSASEEPAPTPEVSSSSVVEPAPTPEPSSSSVAKPDPDPKVSSSSRALQASSSSVTPSGRYSLWELGDGRASLGLGVMNGLFYPYTDAGVNNGTSTVKFPDGQLLSVIDALGPELLKNGGQIIFTTTTAYRYSYAGVAFNWVEPEAVVNPQTTLPDGFSICYTSEKPMFIELKPIPTDVYEYNSFRVKLPPATTPTHKTFTWSQFMQQPDWGIQDPEGVANMLANYSAGIEFKFEGAGADATNKFRLGGLGALTDADHCAAILGGD